ncbi:MAG TPA: hypothetical protein PKX38_09535 [Alphaproteobacteria bacterium]|nr:hypothetical protein [Alphaproteobacteria bacterium]
MPKFRKKPLIVDAMQFNHAGDNGAAVIHWALGHVVANPLDQDREIFVAQIPVPGNEDNVFHAICTRTADGVCLYSEAGDYIIRGEHGEFHIISEDQFNKVYEPIVILMGSDLTQ